MISPVHQVNQHSAVMSSTTLANVDQFGGKDMPLSSGTPTPTRNSLDHFSDEEKLPPPQEPEGDNPPPMSRTRLALLMIGLCLSMFLVALDFNILTTAIPRITDEFQNLNSVAWYGAAFFLTTSSLQGPWGKLYKLFDLKWTVLSALFIFEIGSLVCATSQSNTALIIGRAIQGIGASGLQNGTYTIVGVVLPRHQRPMFTGVLGAMFGITCVIGPLLGGAFTDSLTWRWCFYINLPLGGAVALGLLLSMQTPKQNPRAGMTWKEVVYQMDPLGVVLLVSAGLCILLALQWGGVKKSWNNSSVIGCIIGFIILFTAFVVDQWFMGERASYPFRILKGRNVAIGIAWNFVIGGAFILHMYFLPLYFQSIRGASAISSGIRMLPLIIALTIFSIGAAGFITANGMPMYVMLIGAVLACIGSGLVYTFEINTSPSKWIGYLILLGFGYGFALQLGIIVGQASSKPEDIAVTTAAINFTQTYGGAIFVAVAQNIFSNKLIQGISSSLADVDPQLVISAGATDIRKALTPDQLSTVLTIFMGSLKDAFIVAIALTAVGFFLALGLTKSMRIKGGIKLMAA